MEKDRINRVGVHSIMMMYSVLRRHMEGTEKRYVVIGLCTSLEEVILFKSRNKEKVHVRGNRIMYSISRRHIMEVKEQRKGTW